MWLNVVRGRSHLAPKLILCEGCRIGRRSTISSANQIILESDVLLAPTALPMDHHQNFSDPHASRHAQAVTAGGKIIIERNASLGYGAVVICSRDELVLGRNSVVGPSAVVTRSVPANSVVVGNPAQVVRTMNLQTGSWVRAHG